MRSGQRSDLALFRQLADCRYLLGRMGLLWGRTFWLYLGALGLEQFHILFVTGRFDVAQMIARTALGLALTALLLLIVRSLFAARSRVPWVTVIATLIAVGVLRASTYIVAAGDIDARYILQVCLQSALFTTVSGLLIGIVRVRVFHYQDSIEAARRAAQQLDTQRIATARSVAAVESATQGWIDHTIRPSLDEADALLQSVHLSASHRCAPNLSSPNDDPAEVGHISTRLRELAETVRKASHQVMIDAAQIETVAPAPGNNVATQNRLPLKGFWRRWVNGRPILVITVPLITLILACSTVIRIDTEWLSLLLSAPLQMVFLACMLPLLPRIRRLPTGTGIASIMLIYAGSSLVFCLVQIVHALSSTVNPLVVAWVLFLTVLSTLIVGVVTSMATTLFALLRVNQLEARTYLHTAQWELTGYQHALHSAQRALQNAIHTEVQGRLAYSALALDDANARGMPLTDVAQSCLDALQQARDDVAQATHIVPAAQTMTLQQGMDELVRAWSPLVNITVASDATADFIDADRIALLVHATREAVANAIRHGLATHVNIQLQTNGTVVINDDGIGLQNPNAAPGLTHQSFLDAGGHWDFASSPAGGTAVTLTFN